jgi:hypothetical protein
VKAKRIVITQAMVFNLVIVMPMSPSLLCASLACAWQLYKLKRLSAQAKLDSSSDRYCDHFAPEGSLQKKEFEVAARNTNDVTEGSGYHYASSVKCFVRFQKLPEGPRDETSNMLIADLHWFRDCCETWLRCSAATSNRRGRISVWR